ncbi:MAG: GtrA family protein [Alphaproteobacteria bacterium]|nr:GtrA family protein [Alphaproteobacteria bacterium]MBQ9234912.1 GtrA family protein [Alphaproteobacteria bacterium]
MLSPVKLFWLIWKYWFTLPDKVRFVLVGGFNACVQYVLYVLLLLLLGDAHYQIALSLSWIISTLSSFSTQKIFVFCTAGSWRVWLKEYLKCINVWAVAYVINAGLLKMLVDVCSINPYWAQIIAVSATTVSSYILMKYFAFKH